jgi:hypothetical protein
MDSMILYTPELRYVPIKVNAEPIVLHMHIHRRKRNEVGKMSCKTDRINVYARKKETIHTGKR